MELLAVAGLALLFILPLAYCCYLIGHTAGYHTGLRQGLSLLEGPDGH